MKVIKRTKKDENMIVFGNVFFGILTLGLIIGIFTYILPSYNEINQIKVNAFNEKEKLENYKKEGIPFEKLKENINETDIFGDNISQKNQVSSILNEMTQDFYDKTLKNTKEIDFQIFIAKKIESYKKDSENNEKIDIIGKVLPLYDKSIGEKGQISEFEFINYIESIIETFNLRYKNSIGINNLTYLDEYKLTNDDNSFDKGISQIPVELDITGNKTSIIDFLYFIENVGKVELNEQGEIFIKKPNNNDFINFKDRKLEKDKFKKIEDYNIFNNQIIDIEFIEFKESLDSKNQPLTITENGNEFLKYIKETQEKDKFEVKIKLNFYVKGLPKYKVDEFNSKFNTKLTKIETDLTKLLSIPSLSGNEKIKLKNIKISIDNIKTSTMQDSGNQEENEDALIQKFQNNTLYMNILEGYENTINEINNKINKK